MLIPLAFKISIHIADNSCGSQEWNDIHVAFEISIHIAHNAYGPQKWNEENRQREAT